MSLNDPIADMLTRLRNATQVYKKEVVFPYSKMKHKIVEIFKAKGFIRDFSVEEFSPSKKQIKVFLKYFGSKRAAFQGLQKVSRGGRRIYVNSKNIPLLQGGMGISIISSSHGIITDQEAGKLSVGGELICKVW